MNCKYFILLSICFIISHQAVDLPGVDYLCSGYDAVKLISGTTAQSKYRLFDLTEEGEKFTVNGKTYTTPSISQVTSMSIKSENTCEGVFSKFSEFYSKYTESFSFDIGYQSSNYSLGFQYHQELESAYTSITKIGQAIGISSSWYGMYSISLGPAFLMPLNSMFQKTLVALDKSAKNPTTEAHQAMYNQAIQAFGTHYVSSVIIGGSAKLYTFVNNSYYKETSYERMKEQISIGVQISMIKLKGESQSEELWNKSSEAFRNNSNTQVFFQPSPPPSTTLPPWKAWEAQILENPQVVNCSVSHLSDLAFEYPEVQTHLQQSIDYYLTQGKLPTLADLSKTTGNLQESINFNSIDLKPINSDIRNDINNNNMKLVYA